MLYVCVLPAHTGLAPLMVPGVEGTARLETDKVLSLLAPEQLLAFTFNVPEANALA